MAETKLSQIVKDEVEAMTAQVDSYLKQLWEDIWPSLVELKPPKERQAWYSQIDWQALRATSEHAWALLSADALRLTQREDQRIAGATNAYHDEAVRERAAFRLEQESMGGMQAVTKGGFNMQLPLGKRAV